MSVERMVKAWREASKDLGLIIHAPFSLAFDDAKAVKFILMIEDFGSVRGTVIFSMDNMENIHIPENFGYYCSALNMDCYSNYERQRFVDTLIDWGYFGDKSRAPDWI